MQNVFSHIIQKRYSNAFEDVATDTLAYILNTHESARQGMMKILRELIPDLPNLQFWTQLSEGSIRPDMGGIAGGEIYLFIENKFWAGLTDNQPIAYLEELSKSPQGALLLMIVPAAREQTMAQELSRRMIEAECHFNEQENKSNEIVWYAKTSLGPTLALTSWPRIIEFLQREVVGNPLLQNDLNLLHSLCEAADIGKFLPMNSSDINNQLLPTMILQLGQVVREAVRIGLRKKFLSKQGLTESHTWERSGKYVWLYEKGCVGILFCVHYELWKQYGVSPLWVVFSNTNFGRAHEVEPILKSAIKKTHLLVVMDNGYLAYSINIKPNVDKDQVIQDIVDQLKELADFLIGFLPEKQ